MGKADLDEALSMSGKAKPAVEANSRPAGMQSQRCHPSSQKDGFHAAEQGPAQTLLLVLRGDGHLTELHLRG